MASEGKGKDKDKSKDTDKEKAPKVSKDEAKAAKEQQKAAEAAARPPADPRLKVVKKLTGRFLPKGELRNRHAALMARWNSGEDHGGVTLEELKSLHGDWKASRAKVSKAKA